MSSPDAAGKAVLLVFERGKDGVEGVELQVNDLSSLPNSSEEHDVAPAPAGRIYKPMVDQSGDQIMEVVEHRRGVELCLPALPSLLDDEDSAAAIENEGTDDNAALLRDQTSCKILQKKKRRKAFLLATVCAAAAVGALILIAVLNNKGEEGEARSKDVSSSGNVATAPPVFLPAASPATESTSMPSFTTVTTAIPSTSNDDPFNIDASTSTVPSPAPSSSSSPSASPSYLPTEGPSVSPTTTKLPTNQPSLAPSSPLPFADPTGAPSARPSMQSTSVPSVPPEPSTKPTASPSSTMPSMPPTPSPTLPVTYVPGDLTVSENGVLLSTGLRSRTLARAGQPVIYANREQSDEAFHVDPDAGAVFAHRHDGGWTYVSNSEEDDGQGGVGAVTFDESGEVVRYGMLLTGTSDNCGGGKTPWGTWLSAEEDGPDGQIWEVDPMGLVPARKTKLGGNGGNFESVAYDIRDADVPRFFVTEDRDNGSLRRYTPHPDVVAEVAVASAQVAADGGDNTNAAAFRLLHGEAGSFEYLELRPNPADGTNRTGTFKWVKGKARGEASALQHFNNAEGIDVRDGRCYFVSKRQREMFILDLDDGTYSKHSTKRGDFDGQPDQILHLLAPNDDTSGDDSNPILYFTEDGGRHAGIHGRDAQGNYLTILEGRDYSDETTGLAFSPDRRHLYFAFQDEGVLFDVWREDGRPFDGVNLGIKYHHYHQQ